MLADFIAPIVTAEASMTAFLPFIEVSVVYAFDVANHAEATDIAL